MHRLALVSFVVTSMSLAAQDEASTAVDPAARQRLAKALLQTASTVGTRFDATWGPEAAVKDDPLAVFLGNLVKGKASGRWFDDRLLIEFDGDQGDELIRLGSRMIARDQTRGWRRRSDHFADGTRLGFLPDAALLLRLLGDDRLAVTRRAASALDDRPIELFSITLNEDQVGELCWSGALPEALLTGGAAALQMRIGGGRGGRQPATPPPATVDLAIAIDPAAGLVHEIRVRAWVPNGGKRQIVVGGGRARIALGAGTAAAGPDEADDPDPQAPLQYELGLPLRPTKDRVVMDYTVRISQHGDLEAPPLTEEQERLLR